MKIIKVLLLLVYVFTSSVMVHAFFMGETNITSYNSHTNKQASCHDKSSEKNNSDMCMESCLRPYMEYSVSLKLVLEDQITYVPLLNFFSKEVINSTQILYKTKYSNSLSPPGEFLSRYVGVTLLLI